MSTTFLPAPQMIDDWLAEMQAIVVEYDCSAHCANYIMQLRHGRPSKHRKEIENLLVELDKRPNPMDLVR